MIREQYPLKNNGSDKFDGASVPSVQSRLSLDCSHGLFVLSGGSIRCLSFSVVVTLCPLCSFVGSTIMRVRHFHTHHLVTF